MADQKTEAYGFYKTDSGYLINKDSEGLNAYKKHKAQLRKIESLESELTTIKEDMQEIKTLLKGFLK